MQIRLLTFLFLLISGMSLSSTVRAEEVIVPTVETRMEQKTKEPIVLREQKKMELKQASGEMKVRREAIKQKTENLKAIVEEKREEAKEKFELQREEFKENLEMIKDQQKKTLVKDIDSRVNDLNIRHTERLEKALSKVSTILTRLEEKVASKSAEGEDTTEIDTAIADAHTVIASATAAITAQAGREYVIDITDETTLREEVKKTIQTFKTDIGSAHAKVKAAREAVVSVAKLYGQLHKKETVSITPSVTP